MLLVLYYRAPLDRPLDGFTGVLFLAALLAFGARHRLPAAGDPPVAASAAAGHPRPGRGTADAAGWSSPRPTGSSPPSRPDAFTEPLNRTDGLYFTITVFSTVGFGDIAPVSQLARVLVTVQMIVGLITVGLIAKLVVGAVQVAVARRSAEPEPVDGD